MNIDSNFLTLRSYQDADAGEIFKLFYDTVHTINKFDYSDVELDAWASPSTDVSSWANKTLDNKTIVAVKGGKILGFGDIDMMGFIGHLYVHGDYVDLGIGTVIYDYLESSIKSNVYSTFASITSKNFFQNKGYKVERENTVERNGVLLTNYLMTKNKK